MELTKMEKGKEAPTITIPVLFYELIMVSGEGNKAIGSMKLDPDQAEGVKAQLKQRKDKIVFNMIGTNWPMVINTDKYARIWYEEIQETVMSNIIDPNTGKAATSEKKLVLQ